MKSYREFVEIRLMALISDIGGPHTPGALSVRREASRQKIFQIVNSLDSFRKSSGRQVVV